MLLDPADDSFCLGISMGCTVASASAFMLQAVAHGVRALTMLDDRSIVPNPYT